MSNNTMWDPNVGSVQNPTFASLAVANLIPANLAMAAMTDAASGIAVKTRFARRLSLPVVAAINTDFTVSLPAGVTINSLKVYTTMAYTGTTANISVGSAVGGAQYVAATDISAIGVVTLAMVAAAAAALLALPAGSPNFFIRIAQGATPTAVGAAVLVIEMIQT